MHVLTRALLHFRRPEQLPSLALHSVPNLSTRPEHSCSYVNRHKYIHKFVSTWEPPPNSPPLSSFLSLRRTSAQYTHLLYQRTKQVTFRRNWNNAKRKMHVFPHTEIKVLSLSHAHIDGEVWSISHHVNQFSAAAKRAPIVIITLSLAFRRFSHSWCLPRPLCISCPLPLPFHPNGVYT